jgi:hypothetical protein
MLNRWAIVPVVWLNLILLNAYCYILSKSENRLHSSKNLYLSKSPLYGISLLCRRELSYVPTNHNAYTLDEKLKFQSILQFM